MDIQHVIVLMLENNSFDRMLGAIPGVDGVDPAHPRTNPRLDGTLVPEAASVMKRMLCDPSNKNSKPVDPQHELPDVLAQIDSPDGPNQGFVKNFQQSTSNCKPDCWAEVMKYFDLNSLTVLHTLAQNFAVCDRWFSSLPGPTWPNRFFVHSGTSLGHFDMPSLGHPVLHIYDQNTVYDRLDTAKKTWAIYYGDVPQCLTMTHMLLHPWHFHKMNKGLLDSHGFFEDCQGPEANFPNYAFIEPSYFGDGENDQHPPSDVHLGEALLARVYNAIRANQALWEKSLLVVLYDEHGGFYDHVHPEPHSCVAPDKHVNDGFDFTRLGVRVPAVLISPWLEPQILSDTFDHTSLLKFVTDMWGLGPLGNRTAAAHSFASSWRTTAAPRTDTPAHIPEPPALPNLENQPPNANQSALLTFTQHLEPQIVALAAQKGPAAQKAMTLRVGERLLQSTEPDRQGEVAAARVEQFLALARENTPPPTGVTRAAAKSTKKTAKKIALKRAEKKAAKKKTDAKAGRTPSRPAKKSSKKTTKKVAKKATKRPRKK